LIILQRRELAGNLFKYLHPLLNSLNFYFNSFQRDVLLNISIVLQGCLNAIYLKMV
jgi:hypothetical protein